MFSLGETTTWTAEDALARLKQSVPTGWTFQHTVTDGWHFASLIDSAGIQQWKGEHPDPKILFLDALGWLRVRNHQVKHPAWKPRDREVPLYRPPVREEMPDPPDIDPEEVAAVYKSSR